MNLMALLQGMGGDPSTLQQLGQEGGGQPQEPVHDIGSVESPEARKGMFGIKGTFRDILGLVGDSLRGGSGASLLYTPHRQQEKYADALGSDFLENPENALDRLQQEGFGKEAGDLAKQLRDYEIQKAKASQDAAYRQAQTTEQGYKNLGSLFATADEKTFPSLLEIATRRAEKYGIDPGELPSSVDQAKRWGMDPYRRNRLDQFEEDQDIRERNVNDQIQDRSARRGLTARGQDLSASTSRSNNEARIAAAERRAAQVDKRVRESAGFSGSRSRTRTRNTDTAQGAAPTGGAGKYVLRNGKFVKQ
jgi:hypothetical protein